MHGCVGWLILSDAFEFPPYFKTFLLLGMFCVNKVSEKFSTTGVKARQDGTGGYHIDAKSFLE